MQVNFNPQKQSFTAFTPAQLATITKTTKEAEMFQMEIAKGRVLDAVEIKQLQEVVPKLKEQKNLGVAFLIERILKKFVK